MKRNACIVLPTFNEVDNIPILLPLIYAQQKEILSHELHVVVVDDDSWDGTQDAVKEHMGDFPNLHLITGRKKGFGEACKKGIDYALKKIDPDIIIQMDADLQHDPGHIPHFVRLSNQGFSLIIGSRLMPGGRTPGYSIRRKTLSLFGNWSIRLFAGLFHIHDCTSGYRCIKADIIKKCDLSYLSTSGYSFLSSCLCELVMRGAQVIEVPITFPERIYGESKLGFRDQIEFLLNLAKLRIWKNRVNT